MPYSHFGAQRDGENILRVPTRNSVRTGIAFDDLYTALGLVSSYEEHEASMGALISWPEWMKMERSERAIVIAHQRVRSLVRLHTEEAVDRAVVAKMKANKKKGSDGA